MPFLNADEIAKSLPVDFAGNRELESGRQLLGRISDLSAGRKSFALETTLASRSVAPRVRELQTEGYRAHLFFFYMPLVDEWAVLINTNDNGPRLVAGKDAVGKTTLWETNLWEELRTQGANP